MNEPLDQTAPAGSAASEQRSQHDGPPGADIGLGPPPVLGRHAGWRAISLQRRNPRWRAMIDSSSVWITRTAHSLRSVDTGRFIARGKAQELRGARPRAAGRGVEAGNLDKRGRATLERLREGDLARPVGGEPPYPTVGPRRASPHQHPSATCKEATREAILEGQRPATAHGAPRTTLAGRRRWSSGYTASHGTGRADYP